MQLVGDPPVLGAVELHRDPAGRGVPPLRPGACSAIRCSTIWLVLASGAFQVTSSDGGEGRAGGLGAAGVDLAPARASMQGVAHVHALGRGEPARGCPSAVMSTTMSGGSSTTAWVASRRPSSS